MKKKKNYAKEDKVIKEGKRGGSPWEGNRLTIRATKALQTPTQVDIIV